MRDQVVVTLSGQLSVVRDDNDNPIDILASATVGPQGEPGAGFDPDQVGLLAGRTAYDGQPKNFAYLATDTGLVYFKNSATSGDWSGGVPFAGGSTSFEGDRYAGLPGLVKTVTGSRALVADDDGKVLYCTAVATLTTAAGLGAGFTCTIIQGAAGAVSVAQGAGTTLGSRSGSLTLGGQRAFATLFSPVTNDFILGGDLA